MPEAPKLNLVQKLAAAMDKIGRVPKNGRNEFHKYDYATEGDIADAVRGALCEAGIMLLPTTEKIEWRTPPVKDGKSADPIATVWVKYRLTDGTETIESVFVGDGQDRGDKAIYKAYTGAHKYFLLKTFSIATGDDNDPEREPNTPPTRQPRASKAQQTVDPESASRVSLWLDGIGKATIEDTLKVVGADINARATEKEKKILSPIYMVRLTQIRERG